MGMKTYEPSERAQSLTPSATGPSVSISHLNDQCQTPQLLASCLLLLRPASPAPAPAPSDMKAAALATLLAASATTGLASIDKDRIEALPGWEKKLPSPQFSGYLDVGAGKHLHYWLAQSEGEESGNPAKDPLVFWFNGGPGCSSLDGYFYEHGPMHVIEPVQNTTGVPPLYLNPNRWNRVANVVFLESPAGVGFSYAETPAGTIHNDTSTAEDAYTALTQFFEGFPEYKTNECAPQDNYEFLLNFFTSGSAVVRLTSVLLAVHCQVLHLGRIVRRHVRADLRAPGARTQRTRAG
jgi:carboxypeptidase C (cathepsin A)